MTGAKPCHILKADKKMWRGLHVSAISCLAAGIVGVSCYNSRETCFRQGSGCAAWLSLEMKRNLCATDMTGLYIFWSLLLKKHVGRVGFGAWRKGSPEVLSTLSWVIGHDVLPCWFLSLITKPGRKAYLNGVFFSPIWLREHLILKIEAVIDFI